QAIYLNCPNLRYLKLLIKNSNFSELEKLLINCQYLNGLCILFNDKEIDFDYLFKILTKSSPASLFRFKIYFNFSFRLKSLKLFFDSWKGRHPVFLQTILFNSFSVSDEYDFIEKYKAEGIIKKYDNVNVFEDFEWTQKKFN